MFRTLLKSKIHRATVTQADINYVGSITIDKVILDAADILEYEKVHVLNVSNGNRLETYAIAGEAGSGTVCMNGAAAWLVKTGDKVIVLSYALVSEDDAAGHRAKILFVDEQNRIKEIAHGSRAADGC